MAIQNSSSSGVTRTWPRRRPAAERSAPALAGGPDERDPQDTNTLGVALEIIRRRWLIILSLVVLCVAIAIYEQTSRTKQYKATASVTFDNSSLSQAALSVQTGTTDPTRDGPTNVLVATSLQVATAVKKQLGTHIPATELVNDVSAQVAPNANVLQITASTADPASSARLANAFAEQYIAFQNSSQLKAIDQAQSNLRAQLAALPAGSPERGSIQQSINRLAQLSTVAAGGSQIISQATAPSSPSGMTLKTAIIVGALIGLALAFIVVFLLESLDRHVISSELFRREYRLPVLATIPAGYSGGRAADRAEQLEPYRMLRTSLSLSTESPIRSLLVTSAVSGEGKTTVAVDLAHAIALTGTKVVLVELDLRAPTFKDHFVLDPRSGFTSVVTSRQQLAERLVQPIAEVPNLLVLPSGNLPPNPADLLQSRLGSEVLRDLRATGEIVIIDSPPLNPVADAQVLMSNPLVDAAIIVARSGYTTRDQMHHTRTILDRQLVEPLGIVVTGMHLDTYGYGYGAGRAPARDKLRWVARLERWVASLRPRRAASPTSSPRRQRTSGLVRATAPQRSRATADTAPPDDPTA